MEKTSEFVWIWQWKLARNLGLLSSLFFQAFFFFLESVKESVKESSQGSWLDLNKKYRVSSFHVRATIGIHSWNNGQLQSCSK